MNRGRCIKPFLSFGYTLWIKARRSPTPSSGERTVACARVVRVCARSHDYCSHLRGGGDLRPLFTSRALYKGACDTSLRVGRHPGRKSRVVYHLVLKVMSTDGLIA